MRDVSVWLKNLIGPKYLPMQSAKKRILKISSNCVAVFAK
jgi:hypothetical protein